LNEIWALPPVGAERKAMVTEMPETQVERNKWRPDAT
jgi:hypothetical protein